MVGGSHRRNHVDRRREDLCRFNVGPTRLPVRLAPVEVLCRFKLVPSVRVRSIRHLMHGATTDESKGFPGALRVREPRRPTEGRGAQAEGRPTDGVPRQASEPLRPRTDLGNLQAPTWADELAQPPVHTTDVRRTRPGPSSSNKERFGVRITHFSVQSDHVHLIVEAASSTALSPLISFVTLFNHITRPISE